MKGTLLACLWAGWLTWAFPIAAVSAASSDRPAAKNGRPAESAAVAEAAPVGDATALKLDGELTEEVWTRAQVIDGFLQRDPKEGAAPTYRTEARVAYDARHIYVAVVAVILGQGLLLGDWRLLTYGALMWLGFHAFVLAYEEPVLAESFGAQYEDFRANVPRWIPRLTPWRAV